MKFREILQKSKTSWEEFYSKAGTSAGKQIRKKEMDSPSPFVKENLLTEQQLLYISEYYLALR